MYRNIFSFCVMLIIIVMGSAQEAVTKNKYIVWSENFLLKHSDFNGPKPEEDPWYSATCACELQYKYLDTGYRIFAVFNTEKSWIGDTSLSLLLHEQGHFDICEIEARKARRYLYFWDKAQITSNIVVHVISIYVDSINLMGVDYDYETTYGFDSVYQGLWNEKIKLTLDSLKAFK